LNEGERLGAVLLDIDGVLVYEAEVGNGRRTEVLRLHPDLTTCMKQLNGPVFIVTHRSRREAHQILSCVGMHVARIGHLFAADEIVRCAIKRGRWRSLFQHGLRKSFILPELSHHYGIDPARLCFVDDRLSNIHDMAAAGVGLCLLAPQTCHDIGTLTTFRFQEIVDRFRAWTESIDERSNASGRIIELAECRRAVDDWCRTGVTTTQTAHSMFNAARRLGNRARILLGNNG
jgi:hypothetical protein